ncbi:MAG TPA: 4-aminobutyrate--2-oxoglutarate transaminase [Steroidobacter sp.]|uniref:4-aminobutyrate--2-oxoglutarate transaminase n=1 Tax=Steroidobacter sp. TaxID=1978227 RepID=UPI002EDB8842
MHSTPLAARLEPAAAADRNQLLNARRERAVPRGVASATQVFIDCARNAEVWDVTHRRFIDFASGIAVLNTGHCHPTILAAVERQLQRFTHAAFQVTAYEPYIALAERLNAIAPVRGPAKTILFSTGAEAVENAVKITRAATGRDALIAFNGAFHGRTLLALALTGKTAPYKHGFGRLGGEVYRAQFPIEHHGISVDASLASIRQIFLSDVPPERVAAIIIEPVQGEGGFHPAPTALLQGLRELCDTHGIALIADEVQTGFARTGRMFALEHSGVQADLLVTAKSLAGGLPLSAVTGNAALMDAPAPGGLGGTYAGSPLACAAALAVLDVIEHESLIERAKLLGDKARSRLASFATRTDLAPIGHIRGLGSMIGFDLLAGRGTDEVRQGGAAAVVQRAHRLGLLLLSCGGRGEGIRLLFPLTAPESIVDEGLDLLERALQAD